ncbi:MAG: hypothetical protein RR619_06735, partial [Raoultibacter sp.]
LLYNGLYPVAPHANSVKVTTENGDSVEYHIPPRLLLETLNFVATKDGVLIPADTFFSQFQTFGGLPQIALQAKTEEQHAGLMRAFYDTVIKYDVSERMYGKDSTRINKTEEFEKLCLFLADNIGNRTNLSKIAQALTR